MKFNSLELYLALTVAFTLCIVAAMPQQCLAQADDIRIASSVVCQDVVDRQPVGSGDVFAKETPKVFCFCRVVGATTDTWVTHNWYYQGSLKSSVKLNVRSPNWRTWSSKSMSAQMTGEWMVEILSADGAPLDSAIFFVQ